MKKFWFESKEATNLRELIENSSILKESINIFETIGQCKDILRNIQKILMLNHRLKLNLINFEGENEKIPVPDNILFFSILVLCNCRNLLEQIFLIGDFLEIKENSHVEKAVLSNLKVIYLFIFSLDFRILFIF